MKKLMIMLSILVLLISCGGKDRKNDKSSPEKGTGTSASSGNSESADEIKRYNAFIKTYNDILVIDENLGKYFEDAGTKEAISKDPKIYISSIPDHVINNLKKNLENARNDEVDNTAKAMLLVLEEMKAVTDEMKNYYSGKDFTSDDFAKGQEMHAKLLAIFPKYKETSIGFKNAVKKKTEEQKAKDLARMKKEGRLVAYSMMMYNGTANKVLDEIEKQKLNAANFTEADLTEFKKLQKELIQISDELQKVATPEQLKTEGYSSASFSTFKMRVNDFKASVATLIEKAEKKEKVSETTLKTQFFAETTEGTPENIYKEFNELVNSYNNLIK